MYIVRDFVNSLKRYCQLNTTGAEFSSLKNTSGLEICPSSTMKTSFSSQLHQEPFVRCLNLRRMTWLARRSVQYSQRYHSVSNGPRMVWVVLLEIAMYKLQFKLVRGVLTSTSDLRFYHGGLLVKMALCNKNRSFRILNIQRSLDIWRMCHDLPVMMMPISLYYSLFRLRYWFPRTDVLDVVVAVLFVRCFVLDVAFSKFTRKLQSKKIVK